MMAVFHYKAMTSSGATVKGVIEAPTQAVVIQQLRAQGHYPISASERPESTLSHQFINLLQLIKRPRARAVAMVTQELASLLKAGLELDRALGILIGLDDTGSLRDSLIAVRARVRDGSALADAISGESAFSRFYVSMVRAGEMGGTLDDTLKKLADYLARSLTIRDTIGSALVYPLILMLTAGASVGIILMFVLPEFEPLFADAGHSLPLATRIVMELGHVLRDYWWLLGMIAAGAIFWAHQAWQTPSSRRRIDARLLRAPLLGSLITSVNTERLCRTLGTLIANGVPLPSALAIAKDTLGNSVMAEAVAGASMSLREGDGLADRLGRAKIFPPTTLDLIRIGEETGKLDEMLLRQADLDEQRTRHTVDRLIALLVPVLTIVLGMVVAGLIASMLVAILSINELALH